MNTKKMFWAELLMTAALVMTACSSENDIMETPAETPQAQKTIPYTVIVCDDATTRATVSDDPTNRQLYFADGDKLYVTGTNIKGVLNIQTGTGTANATFSGELTYTGSDSPATDLSLTATLVSAQQYGTSRISVDGAGAVTVNYPTTGWVTSINGAVMQYSRLTGTSTYGAKSFTLTQQTAFLNFVITFEDGTAAGTPLTAVVSNDGSVIWTANITTLTDGGVKAKFVLPVAKGTVLSNANVKMGDKEAISFGASQTLDGKVYNVKKTLAAPAAATGHALTSAVIGDIIGSDGQAYNGTDYNDLPTGVTAVALVAYLGNETGDATYNHGLAIALDDEEGYNDWYTLKQNIEEKTAVPETRWKMLTTSILKKMSKSYGGNENNCSGLRNAIMNVLGQNLGSEYFSGSTVLQVENNAYEIIIGTDGYIWDNNNQKEKAQKGEARAYLVF